MEPIIIKNLFPEEVFLDLKNHITQIRRIFENTPYHDLNEDESSRFNRWYWHNLPLLKTLHNSEFLVNTAISTFGEEVKPTYVFLSMYGEGGVCPLHVDRPQCKYTIDLCISQKEPWPIYVNDKPYILEENQALAYSGTDHPHYRNVINTGNYCNLAFFHFVPKSFSYSLD